MRGRRLRCVVIAAALLTTGTAAAALASAAASPPPRVEDYFSKSDIERSRRYRGPRYAIAFGSIVVSLVAGAAIGLGPGVRRIGRWSASITGGRWILQVLLLAAVVTGVLALVQLPFAVAGHFHDRSFGLVTQSVWGMLADIAKGLAFQLALAAVTGLGFYGIIRALPRAWPGIAALFAVGLTVFLSYVFPVIYEPLFNRFTPVDASLRARVLTIAGKAGVQVGDVLVADASRRTRRLNAYVSGLGPSKRVVLYDTLIERSSPKEVDLVVAHELAHVANHDVLKGTALAAGGAVAAVLLIWGLLSSPSIQSPIGVSGAGDPRSLPFLALVLAATGILALPLQNWYSRGIEAAADRAAIDYTQDPETAIAVEVRLARENIADLEPNRFFRWAFFSHPPVMERIQIALDWESSYRPVRTGGT
jgi:Zn-dependent protease with chaperone function